MRESDIIEFIAKERGYNFDLEDINIYTYAEITNNLLAEIKEEDLIEAIYKIII